MKRRDWFKAATATVIGAWALLVENTRSDAAPNAAHYARCAKACQDCMKACQICSKHCASMVKSGMKAHEKSLHLSEDCMDVCTLCAKLCERQGPMAVALAEACLKACNACGSECGKYATMQPMSACAKSCAVCAKTCQELIAAK